MKGLVLTLLLLLVAAPLRAQPLAAPEDLEVERDRTTVQGRWTAVSGANYYEVWVKKFGRWSFNPKEFETSPITSSFQLPLDDERAEYRVRAVDKDGNPGEFSDEVTATLKKETDETRSETNQGHTSPTGREATFDPKAPPPKPPSGLFAVWTEPTVIKLIWQDSKGAKNYSVEELRDESWISVQKIEFPKENTALIKDHPAPGPYKFRVRAVGNNGRASEPSRATTLRR